MRLTELLEIRRGVTALIGGGGKTGVMYRLAAELGTEHTVICCTTTKIWPPAHLPVLSRDDAGEIETALRRQRVLCVGRLNEQKKLTQPHLPMARLSELATYVLVEADGAAGHPMKAHAPHEPVLPERRNQTILIVGASGFGQQIESAAHRPERYALLAQTQTTQIVTPAIAAEVICREGLHDRVFINQVETPETEAAALALARRLNGPVACGSLRQQRWWAV